MVVITSAIDSRDGVFIGGKHPHHNFQPMTNNELTLDQLTAISGGATAIEYGLIAAMHSRPVSQLRSKTTEAKFKSARLHDSVHCMVDGEGYPE